MLRLISVFFVGWFHCRSQKLLERIYARVKVEGIHAHIGHGGTSLQLLCPAYVVSLQFKDNQVRQSRR